MTIVLCGKESNFMMCGSSLQTTLLKLSVEGICVQDLPWW